MLGDNLLNNGRYSFIGEKVLEQFLLLLRLELTNVNAIDVGNLYLICLYFNALNVLKLSQRPPLSHIFLHFIDVLYKYHIELTLLSTLPII